MTRVRDLMAEDVLCVTPEMPLLDAAKALSQRQVGAAPVCLADGRVVGVLSKSDLVDRFGQDPARRVVAEAMTPMALSVGPNSQIEEAIREMVFEGVHHLIVLDERGRLRGVLSASDILRHLSGFPRRDNRVIAMAPPEDRFHKPR